MAAHIGARADQDCDGKLMAAGGEKQELDSQHDIIFLVGFRVRGDEIKVPQIFLGPL